MKRFLFVTLAILAMLLQFTTSAHAQTSYTLTRIVNPQGSGQILCSPQAAVENTFAAGTTVTVYAQPASGFTFVSWANGSTSVSQQIVMNENKTVQANFTTSTAIARFSLTRLVYPTNGGEISVDPLPGNDGKYSSGTVVTLTAHAATGYNFYGWNGGFKDNPHQVVMSENKTVTAYFVSTDPTRFALVKGVYPAASGDVTADPLPGTDGKYSSGTVVTLTAHPAAGYAFGSWSGGSTANPLQVVMTQDKTINAYFTAVVVQPRFTLTLLDNPDASGTITPSPLPGDDGKYSSGTVVVLTAHPATGWAFNTWTGVPMNFTTIPNPNPVYVKMTEDRTVTANFVQVQEPPRFTLTRIVNPPGSGEITISPLPGQDGKYTSGTVVQLTAKPASGWIFNSWTGAPSPTAGVVANPNPTYVIMTEDRTVTANFVQVQDAPRFTLTLGVNPDNGSTVTASPLPGDDGKYSSGTIVVLTAHPATGWAFSTWIGIVFNSATIPNPNPAYVKMNEDRTVTANFVQQTEQPRFTLTRIVNPAGSGEISVTPLPGSDGKYSSGTIVTMYAHPLPGFTFTSWSGAASGDQNPKPIVMNENKTVTANFSGATVARFTLTKAVTPAGAGEIEVTPLPGTDGKYSSGTVVTLNAHPFPGYTFAHWYGASTSTSNPIELKMTENKSIAAVFEQVSAPASDLMIQASLSHNPVLVNSPFIVNIHVANLGPSEATNVHFELHLNSHLAYTSSTISQGSLDLGDANVLVGTLGTLPAGGHAVAAAIVSADTTGSLDNVAHVAGDQPDPYLANNEAHCVVKVYPAFTSAPDLTGFSGLISRTAQSTGSKLTGTFVIVNDGDVPSGKCTIKYYLSQDDTLDPQDQFLGTGKLKSVAPKSAVNKHYKLKVPANAEGSHVIVALDAGDSCAENDEINNLVVSPAAP